MSTQMDSGAEQNAILELVHAVDESTQEQDAHDQSTLSPQYQAQIWAYRGVGGGVGVSALCVQTAYQLAQDGHKVILVDLDFERGDGAAFLDMQPSLCVDELNQAEGRLDVNLTANFIKAWDKNLSVLSAAGRVGDNDRVSVTALLALLDNISTMYDFAVLDIPECWQDWTQITMAAADKLALVCEARVPALHRAKRLCMDIQSALNLSDRPEVILGKYERRTVRGGLGLGDCHKVLGFVTEAQIINDEECARTAINSGLPMGKIRANSRVVKSVKEHITDRLISAKKQNPARDQQRAYG